MKITDLQEKKMQKCSNFILRRKYLKKTKLKSLQQNIEKERKIVNSGRTIGRNFLQIYFYGEFITFVKKSVFVSMP